MGPGNILLFFLASLVVAVAYRGFRDRLRKGKFITRRIGGRMQIETDLGKFTFDTNSKRIRIEAKGTFMLPFDEVISLGLMQNFEDASLSEFLFEDFNLLDLFSEYRDKTQSYTINIVTRTGVVPFFYVSQYQVRDFWDFFTPFAHSLLRALRCYKDVDTYAKTVHSEAELAFQQSGIPLQPSRGYF